MGSAHQETSFSYKESMTIEAAESKDAAGAILTLSQDLTGKNLKESMAEYKKQQQEETKKRQQENAARSMQQLAEANRAKKNENQYEVPDEIDSKIKMLRRLLAALRGEKIPEDCKIQPDRSGKVYDLRSSSFRLSAQSSISMGSLEVGTTGSGTTWQKITATSGFHAESEITSFASTGKVQTADGRSIDFNIELSDYQLNQFQKYYE